MDWDNQMEVSCAQFTESLMSWWPARRRDFPWREAGLSPYSILVAEVLLRRTTATAAARVFPQVIRAYPDVLSLSRAETSDLAGMLLPLGLHHQRANALLRISSQIVSNHGSHVPNDLQGLLSLPQVGPYVAHAVLVFGFGQVTAVVDANVTRIARRFVGQSMGLKTIQALVDRMVPSDGHREFNWAMLDFGALVCRYAHPLCSQCPVGHLCHQGART